jgi:hypothetical protein
MDLTFPFVAFRISVLSFCLWIIFNVVFNDFIFQSTLVSFAEAIHEWKVRQTFQRVEAYVNLICLKTALASRMVYKSLTDNLRISRKIKLEIVSSEMRKFLREWHIYSEVNFLHRWSILHQNCSRVFDHGNHQRTRFSPKLIKIVAQCQRQL